MKEVSENFDYVKINLASPMRIRIWGQRLLPNGQVVGEVTKPDTLNYRTFKPEMDGLFCERIFGPAKNWECHCGKYKQVRHQGLVCEKCGVDITESRVRRHRMGHVRLKTPVSHVWYLKGSPSYLSYLLNLKLYEVEEILYFNHFSEEEQSSSGDNFFLKNKIVGAEVVLNKLKTLNLEREIEVNRKVLLYTTKKEDLRKIRRRIRILESFLSTNSRPEWMILTILPVIPAGLRPMIQLESGTFATVDLNELYRRVITRNNRLGRLLSSNSPDIVIRSEKRKIQEAVDTLIDNGKHGPKMLDLNKRPLKSLADIVKGKQGRFRQNLLGKRVDYSGRSVIVVGPSLDLNQCGLPYEMSLELFYPFIVYELIQQGLAATVRNAKKIIQNPKSFLWDLVQDCIKNHPILLNRAPTLHRLGVQAFEPILVQGRAIQLHPLVCTAFNADFDGDQMAVHIPLSLEAQTEARILMMASNNFLSPATGEPILQPTQDMLLGSYYLSLNNPSKEKAFNAYFNHFEEVLLAYEQKQLSLHSCIWVRCSKYSYLIQDSKERGILQLKDQSVFKVYKNAQFKEFKNGKRQSEYILTTPGRILFNHILHTMQSS